MSNSKNPCYQIEMVGIETLIPYAKNSRTHSDAQVAQIAGSIREFGFTNPVLIDAESGIIAGHGRVLAARKLDLTEVPCIRLALLTETQRRAYVIADNKLALNAGWDDEILKLELEALREEFDLGTIGFSEEELTAMGSVQTMECAIDPDAVPEAPLDPVTRLGDIWTLGRHRLMCGDSTSVDAVQKLTKAAKVDMVFTDPPYGIKHSGKGIGDVAGGVAAANNFGEIFGDQDVTAAVDAFNLCVSMWPEARLIFWGANYYANALPNGHGWLVWDKQRGGEVFSGAELAFVNGGVRVDVFRHQWDGMIKASEHGQARVHPTQKPIALAEWCFSRHGNPKTVVDLFGGSGSTLIACEKTGRDARLMELDPKYCDVILNRWQTFSGGSARHESGETFNSLRAKTK
jgi:16S rRNA G966 N2-methylase RsmD